MVTVSVDVPEPDWAGAEDSWDLNSEGETVVNCSACEASFDAYVVNNAGDCQITLADHSDTIVLADTAFFSPEEESWVEDDLPDNPYSIWKMSHDQLRSFLEAHGETDGGALINRMVFAQHVVALEAYLGDTLLKSVLGDPKVLGRLLENDTDLSKDKFTLREIQDNPDLIRDRVTAYLRDVRYHNLAKVNVLYRNALGVDLLADREKAAPLMEAMRLRHDCIHRNGFDKQGTRLTQFTMAYVAGVANAFRDLVNRLDLALSPF